MDSTTAIVIVIIVFAVIAVASFLVFRQKTRIKIKGPQGTGFELEADNTAPLPRPGIEAEGIKSRKGGIVAEDQTGRGVKAKDFEAEDDVLLGSSDPKSGPST